MFSWSGSWRCQTSNWIADAKKYVFCRSLFQCVVLSFNLHSLGVFFKKNYFIFLGFLKIEKAKNFLFSKIQHHWQFFYKNQIIWLEIVLFSKYSTISVDCFTATPSPSDNQRTRRWHRHCLEVRCQNHVI